MDDPHVAARHRIAAIAGVLVLAAGATACGPVGNPFAQEPRACTLIGCESSVTFELSSVDLQPQVGYQVRVCLDGDCTHQTFDPEDTSFTPVRLDREADQIVWSGLEGDLSGDHELSLEVRDEAGAIVASTQTTTRFEGSRPNGEGCPPVCWAATIDV